MRELDELVEAAARRTAEAYGDRVVRDDEAAADVADWLLEELPEAANAAARLGGSFELHFVELWPIEQWGGVAIVEVRCRGSSLRLGKVSTSSARTLLGEAAEDVLGWYVYRGTRYLRPPLSARTAPEAPARELPPARGRRARPPARKPAEGVEAKAPRTPTTPATEQGTGVLAREPRGLSAPAEADDAELPAPAPMRLRPARRRGAYRAKTRRGRR